MKTKYPPGYHHYDFVEPYIMCPSAYVATKPLW